MKVSRKIKLLLVVMVLLLAALACGPKPTETPLDTSFTQEPVEQGLPQQPSGTPSGILSTAQRQALMHATVQVLMLYNEGGQLQPKFSGSGTILTPDGIILTNCHVAAPDIYAAANGFTDDPVADLGISVVDRADQPPIASYFAKVMAVDGVLDLAVIKIDRMLDGSPVTASNLNLPYVQIGDSDKVELGDPVFVFGFPTIGGETITYTTGSVSGFDSESIGDRAWIKTDAMIAGGNSGGLAADSNGTIIGVPSRGGTSSASKITDCRQIADTNGDGVIDEKDTCVPMGGFINAIRPIKWALPMIQSARQGIAYVSPYGQGQQVVQQQPISPASGWKFRTWAEDADNQNCPINPLQSYPTGATVVHANFQYGNMTTGAPWGYRWYIDGREVFSNQPTWNLGQSGNCFDFSLDNGGDAMPDGNYKLEVYAGPNMALVGSATTQVGGSGQSGSGQSSGGVQLQGQVKDANTGRGIQGILIVLLRPGLDPDQWLEEEETSESDIVAYVESGSDGYYQINILLERGKKYGVIAGSKKLGYPAVTGYISFDANTPAVANLPLQLSK